MRHSSRKGADGPRVLTPQLLPRGSRHGLAAFRGTNGQAGLVVDDLLQMPHPFGTGGAAQELRVGLIQPEPLGAVDEAIQVRDFRRRGDMLAQVQLKTTCLA
jgi:hypothetical protein